MPATVGSSDYSRRDRICRRSSNETPDPAKGTLRLLAGRSADLRGEEERGTEVLRSQENKGWKIRGDVQMRLRP